MVNVTFIAVNKQFFFGLAFSTFWLVYCLDMMPVIIIMLILLEIPLIFQIFYTRYVLICDHKVYKPCKVSILKTH